MAPYQRSGGHQWMPSLPERSCDREGALVGGPHTREEKRLRGALVDVHPTREAEGSGGCPPYKKRDAGV